MVKTESHGVDSEITMVTVTHHLLLLKLVDSLCWHLCQEIYGLRCTGVPTARPNVRRDYPDVVYKTEEAKLNAIVEDWDRLAASTSTESGY